MPNTVILATQRTGSTLLCSEFGAIGGLGKPGEHFLGWLRQAGSEPALDSRTMAEITAAGRDETGAVGVKLMADYLPALGRAWIRATGGTVGAAEETGEAEAACLFLAALADLVGPAAVFRIDRADRFDQALSRHLATATGVYFRTVEGDVRRAPDRPAEITEDAALTAFDSRKIEQVLGHIARETVLLDEICARLSAPVHALSYEALASERETTLAACCAHAGVAIPVRWPERWMKKVVEADVRSRYRAHAHADWQTRRKRGVQLPELSKIFAAEPAEPADAG